MLFACEPNGTGQIARNIAPDVIAAFPLQTPEGVVRFLEHSHVRVGHRGMALQPCLNRSGWLVALGEIEHLLKDGIEKPRFSGNDSGKAKDDAVFVVFLAQRPALSPVAGTMISRSRWFINSRAFH